MKNEAHQEGLNWHGKMAIISRKISFWATLHDSTSIFFSQGRWIITKFGIVITDILADVIVGRGGGSHVASTQSDCKAGCLKLEKCDYAVSKSLLRL